MKNSVTVAMKIQSIADFAVSSDGQKIKYKIIAFDFDGVFTTIGFVSEKGEESVFFQGVEQLSRSANGFKPNYYF